MMITICYLLAFLLFIAILSEIMWFTFLVTFKLFDDYIHRTIPVRKNKNIVPYVVPQLEMNHEASVRPQPYSVPTAMSCYE